MATIDIMLREMVESNASDLHLSAASKPFMRVHGVMASRDHHPVMTSDGIMAILQEIMPEYNMDQFKRDWDTDFAYEVEGLGRFRINAFRDRLGVGTVMRLIPSRIPTMEELNLPAALRDFCHLSKGLVLVTGPTGSGKSTTLAALIGYINQIRTEHIITIEDPIEFVHHPVKCLINQREVHRDTESFSRALRAALREDPDIVLVGEMRDLETIEIAIETAETGHLVFGTLHTNSAPATIDRVIDKFPADRQNQIRTMLGDALQGVVAQTLCSRIGGGRIAAFEVLVVNVPVASHIREGKTFMIPSVMQTSRSLGMQTFSEELTRMVLQGKITTQEAYFKAVNKDEMRIALENNGLPLDFLKDEQTVTRDRTAEATALLERLRRAHDAAPHDINAINDLAWGLATTPVEKLRNGREALKLAERAVKLTKSRDAATLDTLGVACAATGAYRRAADYESQALELARAMRQDELIGPLTMRRKLFQDGKPFVEEL